MHSTDVPGPLLAAGVYDPAVTSDGLTLDTPTGPVDLVAVARASVGRRTATTAADREYLLDLLARGVVTGRALVAAGLGMSGRTVNAMLADRSAGSGAAA